MNRLNPKILFERIARDIPTDLHRNLIVTGSLAAAYQFHAELDGNAVNTKDADLVVLERAANRTTSGQGMDSRKAQ